MTWGGGGPGVPCEAAAAAAAGLGLLGMPPGVLGVFWWTFCRTSRIFRIRQFLLGKISEYFDWKVATA